MNILMRLTIIAVMALGTAHSVMAMSTGFGTIDGLGIGVVPHNTAILPASSIGSSSSFIFSELPLLRRGSATQLPTDTWVFGEKVIPLYLPRIGQNEVIQSAILEISSGGHGLGSLSSIFLEKSPLGFLSDGDGIGPRNPEPNPPESNPTYNALFLDMFDLGPHIPFLTDRARNGGPIYITIKPGGGSRDGWALDGLRLNLSVADQEPVVTDLGTSPVPLPAAFWLFATGLVSLLGIRKKS